MFYIKHDNELDGVHIKAEITTENIFCTCPHCGAEFQCGELLISAIQNTPLGDFELESTAILCDDCTRKRCGKPNLHEVVCVLK